MMSNWRFYFLVFVFFSFSVFYSTCHYATAQSIDQKLVENPAVLFKANTNRTGYFKDYGPLNEQVRKLWSFETINSTIEASPIVYGSTLYLGSSSDHLYAIDITTGTEKWRSDSTGYFRSSPAIENNLLYR